MEEWHQILCGIISQPKAKDIILLSWETSGSTGFWQSPYLNWSFNFNVIFTEPSILVVAVADCSTFKALYAFLTQLLEDRYETLTGKAKAT